jgi:hypothetical protein
MMSDLLDAVKELAEAQRKVNAARINQLMQEQLLDADGYPTEAALSVVKLWPWQDKKGWFDFIKQIWWSTEYGWNEGESIELSFSIDKLPYYELSTLGWSGNEAIIRAMQENTHLWDFVWYSSYVGGHYTFRLRIGV